MSLNECKSPTIIWKGEEMNFTNIEQARAFARNHKLEAVLGLSQVTYFARTTHSKAQKSTVEIFDGIKAKIIEEAYGSSKAVKYSLEGKSLLGVSKALDNYRSEDTKQRVLNEFNMENYEAVMRADFIEKAKAAYLLKTGLNAPEAELKRFEKEADLELLFSREVMSFKQKAGTAEHKIAEIFFTLANEGKFLTLEDAEKLAQEAYKEDNKTGILSQKALADYLTGLHDFYTYLTTKYDSPVFLCEQVVGQANENLNKILEFNKSTEGKKGIIGYIDLLVVDKNGKVGMYDFKTSTKEHTDWSEDKIDGANMQQTMYRNIIRNLGIPDTDIIETALVPIHFNAVDLDKKEILGIQFGKGADIVKHVSISKPFQQLAVSKIVPLVNSSVLKAETQSIEVRNLLKDLFDYEAQSTTKERDLDVELEKVLSNEDRLKPGVFYMRGTTGNEVIKVDKNLPNWQETLKAKVKDKLTIENEIYRSFPKRLIKYFQDLRTFKSHGEGSVPVFAAASSDATNDQIYAAISEYVNNPEWKVVTDNESANELGIVIFHNPVSNVYHFVNLTTNRIKDKLYKGEKGTTLLGKTLNDTKATRMGLEKDATVGDMEMLKVYAFIQSNKNTFKNAKIGTIRTLQNNYTGEVTNAWSQFNHELQRQWNIISKTAEASTLGFKSWTPEFDDYANSLIFYLSDVVNNKNIVQAIRSESLDLAGMIKKFQEATPKLEDLVAYQRQLESLLSVLTKARLNANSKIANSTEELLIQLTNYLTHIKGLKLKNQRDWDVSGDLIGSHNTNYTPGSQIGHSYAQELRVISGSVQDNIRKNLAEIFDKSRKVFSDFYGDNLKEVKLVGYGVKYCIPLLETDETGKYTGRIVKENTPGLTEREKTFIKDLTQMIYEQRVDYLHHVQGRTLDSARALASQFMYELPVMKAGIMTMLAKGSPKDYLRKWTDYVFNPEYFQEVDDNKKMMSNAVLEVRSAFAASEPWNDRARREFIDGLNNSEIEEDFETMFNMFAMTTQKSVELNKKKTELTLIQTMAHLNEQVANNDIPNIAKWIDDYVSYALLGKRDVEEGAKKKEVIIRTAGTILSTMKMTFKPTAFVTESVQGMGNITSKILSYKMAGDSKRFGAKEARQAAEFILRQTADSEAMLADLVDRIFRVSTASNFEMVEKAALGRRGGKRLSYWSYIQYSAPDFANRMTVVIAQMLKDGTIILENGKVSEKSPLKVINGMLAYNEELDPRFSVYLSNKEQVNPSEEWQKQKALHEAHLESMLKDNPSGVENGKLLMPYTPREVQSLRTFTNRMFGFYSDEDKIVAARFGFMKLFMQFKTWAIPKVQKIYKHSSQIDEGEYVYVKDENGNIIGADWQYAYTEGIAQTLMSLIKDSKLDLKAYAENWGNLSVEQRENVFSVLVDALLFLLFSIMCTTALNMVGDSDDVVSNSARVGLLSVQKGFQDLNTLSVMGAMIGIDGHPIPIVGATNDFITRGMDILTKPSLKSADSFADQFAIYKQVSDLFGKIS